MLDIIELIANLFTEPAAALATIILVPTLLVVLYWFGRRAGSRWSLDQPPEMVARQMLRFTDDDLTHNRKGRISPTQARRYGREIIMTGAGYVVTVIVMLWITSLFPSRRMEIFRLVFGAVMIILTAGFFGWLIRRSLRDLRANTVLTLITRWELEAHKSDFMMIPVTINAYNLVVRHPALKQPLKMRLGFLSPAAYTHMTQLNGAMLLLYITSRASRLLSCEIVRDPQQVAALEKALQQFTSGTATNA